MFKTIATFAALATLAATTIAPAHAYEWLNGGGSNGVSLNGGGPNGISLNGGGTNGLQYNGGGNNGLSPNGGGSNGEFKNGGSGNGAASGSSTLTIQAIELPPETR